MAFIQASDANAWADKSKLNITVLDADLESQTAAEVLGRVSAAYDVSAWTGFSNTPTLVRKIISMLYVGWFYERTYSEDEDTSNYGAMLIDSAERLLIGIESGQTVIDGLIPSLASKNLSADFYPTDLSSAGTPNIDDPSLGGPAFTMGQIW
jgi:hypothetical protein